MGKGREQAGRAARKTHTHVSEPLFFQTDPGIEEIQEHGYSYSGITALGVFGFLDIAQKCSNLVASATRNGSREQHWAEWAVAEAAAVVVDRRWPTEMTSLHNLLVCLLT